MFYLLLPTLLLFLVSPAQAASISTDFFSQHPGASNLSNVGFIFSSILPNVLIFAGVFFLLLIIYAGYQLIILGGQYNPPARVAQAKNMVTYALIGFLIVISAYFILQIIGVVTTGNSETFINSPLNI